MGGSKRAERATLRFRSYEVEIREFIGMWRNKKKNK